MKRERDIFLTALLFFSRIPVPKWLHYHYEAAYLQASSRYFPLVGSLIGALTALSYWLAQFIFSDSLAILISMATSILLTGAFHEDGWADSCDALGGGQDKSQTLAIMKDSRLGTYGVIGLFFMLSLKATALYQLSFSHNFSLILITAHALSRFMAVSLIYTHEYVRDDNASKSKPLATSMSCTALWQAALWGLLPLFFLPWHYWLVLPLLWGLRFFWAGYLTKRLGGYTGDILGASQQLSEIIFYILLLCIMEL